MIDRVSPERRSEIMSLVRSVDTEPELKVRRLLHRLGFRYRLHRRDLPGTPDIVLPARKTVILVHGCFWHGHEGCSRARVPATRSDYWWAKISRNKARDALSASRLSELGWRVYVVWECETRQTTDLAARLLRIFDRTIGASEAAALHLKPRGRNVRRRTPRRARSHA